MDNQTMATATRTSIYTFTPDAASPGTGINRSRKRVLTEARREQNRVNQRSFRKYSAQRGFDVSFDLGQDKSKENNVVRACSIDTSIRRLRSRAYSLDQRIHILDQRIHQPTRGEPVLLETHFQHLALARICFKTRGLPWTILLPHKLYCRRRLLTPVAPYQVSVSPPRTLRISLNFFLSQRLLVAHQHQTLIPTCLTVHPVSTSQALDRTETSELATLIAMKSLQEHWTFLNPDTLAVRTEHGPQPETYTTYQIYPQKLP
jgi:hypothetical protein